MDAASPGAGPSRGRSGGRCGGDGDQPPLGDREGLYAHGRGQWPSPRAAQYRVSAGLLIDKDRAKKKVLRRQQERLCASGTHLLPVTSAFIHLIIPSLA